MLPRLGWAWMAPCGRWSGFRLRSRASGPFSLAGSLGNSFNVGLETTGESWSGGRNLQLDLGSEQHVGNMMLYIFFKLLKGIIGFALELNQRVSLGDAPKLDSNPEHIQVVDMVLPQAIHYLKDDL